ncbi:MAG: N-6 DNA methylase, partial [Bacteroidia bacterium]|nr:N-6 DNA methylase [Bacteroidia bacterium]
AKAPGTNLTAIEHTSQLKRYLETFPNLILTDFYEFRLYREGKLLKQVVLADAVIAQRVKELPPARGAKECDELLTQFLSYQLTIAPTPEELARKLAQRTRFLRDEAILPELSYPHSPLQGLYEAFTQYLLPHLSPQEFADLYAQTLTYGLFVARLYAKSGLSRLTAFAAIPESLGILREIFRFVSSEEPSENFQVIIEDIIGVLRAVEVEELFRRYKHEPILHFYETFLAEYAPEERERRGVYYTPLPVVRYIVRAVDRLLRERFGLGDGLADTRVTLLDPAAGTLTFVIEAIRHALDTYAHQYGKGAVESLIRQHILKNFYAFELLMAPYVIGHLHIGHFLQEEAHFQLQKGERFPLYLTNTLEMEDIQQTTFPFVRVLSEEGREAGRIKKETPILVILGNPPYSGHSATTNEWTESLLKEDKDGVPSYYKVEGKPLGEKNPKWLQDDYVKFLRWAQWKIHTAGRGIVAMITNHSYLDNPTFRGMRYSLLQTFDEIYILDLHGNSLKREKAPDGSPDENVFDIRQGVAIGIFIKYSPNEQRRPSSRSASSPTAKNKSIYHAELWGKRGDKYAWLESHSLPDSGFQPITPEPPFYFLQPKGLGLDNYLTWLPVNKIFPTGSVGIVTSRDNLTIQWSEYETWQTVLRFSKMDPELARETYSLGKDVRDWKVSWAQKDLLDEGGPSRDKITPILYRPFDIRYTYYTGKSRGFHCMPRPDVMRHMLAGENVGLLIMRQVSLEGGYTHVLV